MPTTSDWSAVFFFLNTLSPPVTNSTTTTTTTTTAAPTTSPQNFHLANLTTPIGVYMPPMADDMTIGK